MAWMGRNCQTTCCSGGCCRKTLELLLSRAKHVLHGKEEHTQRPSEWTAPAAEKKTKNVCTHTYEGSYTQGALDYAEFFDPTKHTACRNCAKAQVLGESRMSEVVRSRSIQSLMPTAVQSLQSTRPRLHSGGAKEMVGGMKSQESSSEELDISDIPISDSTMVFGFIGPEIASCERLNSYKETDSTECYRSRARHDPNKNHLPVAQQYVGDWANLKDPGAQGCTSTVPWVAALKDQCQGTDANQYHLCHPHLGCVKAAAVGVGEDHTLTQCTKYGHTMSILDTVYLSLPSRDRDSLTLGESLTSTLGEGDEKRMSNVQQMKEVNELRSYANEMSRVVETPDKVIMRHVKQMKKPFPPSQLKAPPATPSRPKESLVATMRRVTTPLVASNNHAQRELEVVRSRSTKELPRLNSGVAKEISGGIKSKEISRLPQETSRGIKSKESSSLFQSLANNHGLNGYDQEVVRSRATKQVPRLISGVQGAKELRPAGVQPKLVRKTTHSDHYEFRLKQKPSKETSDLISLLASHRERKAAESQAVSDDIVQTTVVTVARVVKRTTCRFCKHVKESMGASERWLRDRCKRHQLNDGAEVCDVSKNIACSELCILLGLPDEASTKEACEQQTTVHAKMTSGMCSSLKGSSEKVLDLTGRFRDQCGNAYAKKRACCFAGCQLPKDLMPPENYRRTTSWPKSPPEWARNIATTF